MFKNFKITTKIIVSFITFGVIITALILTTSSNILSIKNAGEITKSIESINTKMGTARAEEITYSITGHKDNVFRSKTFMDEALLQWETLSDLYKTEEPLLIELKDSIINFKEQLEELSILKEETESLGNTLIMNEIGMISKSQSLYEKTKNETDLSSDIYISTLLLKEDITQYKMTSDERYITKANNTIQKINEDLLKYQTTDPNILDIKKSLEDKITAVTESLDAYASGNELDQEASASLSENARAYDDIYARLVLLNNTSFEEASTRILISTKIIAVLSVFFTLVAMFILYRSISKPIRAFLTQIKFATQNNDLTTHIDVGTKDEINKMAKSFNAFASTVHALVYWTNEHTHLMVDSAQDVHSNMTTLNEHIQDIYSIIEEISATMETTAATSQQMSVATESLDQTMSLVSKKAKQGVEHIKTASTKAQKVNATFLASESDSAHIYETSRQALSMAIEDSKAIEEIHGLTNVILQITEDTNLLALNAAIEAARAGESGKGFNVVATEIRKLAQHSKNTASQIQTITNTVVSVVNQLVEESHNLMNYIDHQVKRDYQSMIALGKDYTTNMLTFERLLLSLHDDINGSKTSVEETNHSISAIATTIHSGSASINDVTKNISDIVDISANVTNDADNINQVSKTLREKIIAFKINP